MLLFVGTASAQILSGHYGPGLFGLRSAGGFPTGWSYVNVTHIYYAGEMKDNEGKISTIAKPVNVIANISGGMWGTQLESINAKYNAALVLPFTNLAPNPETLELDPERIGLGDIYLIPAMLSWSFDRFSLNTRYGLWVPTGEFNEGSRSNRGKGFWSHNLGLGTTISLNQAKTWTLSGMGTYEFHSKQQGTDIRPADMMVVEWGLGKTIEEVFNMGLIGYSNMQIGQQKGGNIPDGLKNYQVHALGVEFNYRTQNRWVFITRWYLEHSGINRPEGTVIRFIFLKNFG